MNDHGDTFDCTCCGGPAPAQCDDHDTGYGVCASCLAEHGRKNFCHVNCRAHGPVERQLNLEVTAEDMANRELRDKNQGK